MLNLSPPRIICACNWGFLISGLCCLIKKVFQNFLMGRGVVENF
jgi:hypothetical protein